MKKIFSIALLMLHILTVYAYDFEVDGIAYNIVTKSGETFVSVAELGNFKSYSGDIIIPEKVIYDSKEYVVKEIGNKAFSSARFTSIKIPNTIVSIGDYSFSYSTGLSTVNIPNSVTSIGEFAFHSSGITSIIIPNSVVGSIGNSAFSYCTSLVSVVIGDGITTLDSYVFDGCTSLTTVSLGRNFAKLGSFCFNDCSAIRDFYCHAENIPAWGSAAFHNMNLKDCVLYVPANSVELYKEANYWKDFGNIVPLTDGISTPTKKDNRNEQIHDLSGKQHNTYFKGINIVGGKKIMMK